MHAEFRTDRGRIRHHNEDNGGVFENKDKQPIVIVADGMGGTAQEMLRAKWQFVYLATRGKKRPLF